jgi:hypothetical protein
MSEIRVYYVHQATLLPARFRSLGDEELVLNSDYLALEAKVKKLVEVIQSMHIDDCGWDIPNLDVTVSRAWHLSNNEKIEAALKEHVV